MRAYKKPVIEIIKIMGEERIAACADAWAFVTDGPDQATIDEYINTDKNPLGICLCNFEWVGVSQS